MIKTIATGYMAFKIGIEILKIVVNPRLHTKNENPLIKQTHVRYLIFLNYVEKYCEIELIRPTLVVKQASVKMAASK